MALAVDATSSDSAISADTLTVPHTCTGSDLALVVCMQKSGAVNVTDCQYNSTVMTASVSFGSRNHRIFTLANPDTGTNNWVVDLVGTASETITGGGVSFTGADTADLVGATGTTTNTTDAAPSTTITTDRDGSYVVDSLFVNGTQTITVDGSQTAFEDLENVAGQGGAGSYELKATAGSIDMDWTLSGSVQWDHGVAEIQELVTASSFTPKAIMF